MSGHIDCPNRTGTVDAVVELVCMCGAKVVLPLGTRRKCKGCGVRWHWDGYRIGYAGFVKDPHEPPHPFTVTYRPTL